MENNKIEEIWKKDHHRSEKILDEVLQDLDYYEEIDSSFPEGYNMAAVHVMLMSRIANSLEQIVRIMKDDRRRK